MTFVLQTVPALQSAECGSMTLVGKSSWHVKIAWLWFLCARLFGTVELYSIDRYVLLWIVVSCFFELSCVILNGFMLICDQCLAICSVVLIFVVLYCILLCCVVSSCFVEFFSFICYLTSTLLTVYNYTILKITKAQLRKKTGCLVWQRDITTLIV